MKNIIILGFPKCGTTSLMPYLAEKHKIPVARNGGFYTNEKKPTVQRREWSFLPYEEHLKLFKREFGEPKNYKITFITRDPVARCWSGYNAWKHYIPFTYEEYLQITNPNDLKGLKYLGEVNPIKQVDYNKWLKPWLDNYGEYVTIYKLEDLIKEPDFPHKNSLNPPKITKDVVELTKKYLEKNGISPSGYANYKGT